MGVELRNCSGSLPWLRGLCSGEHVGSRDVRLHQIDAFIIAHLFCQSGRWRSRGIQPTGTGDFSFRVARGQSLVTERYDLCVLGHLWLGGASWIDAGVIPLNYDYATGKTIYWVYVDPSSQPSSIAVNCYNFQ